MTRAMKGPLGWLVLAVAAIGIFSFGVSRDTGPRTDAERVYAISERIACPVCDGESVADSQNPASDAIEESIRNYVRDGELDDDEIIDAITSAREGQELLLPSASGIQALAWAIPAVVFVIAVVSLAFAFRRWGERAARIAPATDADYALVEAARSGRREQPDTDAADDGDGTA